MKIIYKKVSELIPYVNNPRKNDKAVDAVASSIKNYGFRNAILIDAKNEIINGHTRLKAAQKLGMLEVPCVMAEDLTPSQVKGLRIADNKVAEAAEWDYDLLKIELDDIDDFTGFDLDDLNLNDKEITEDDFNTDEALENIEEPITKRGDIWKLGNHRLMCGDSTSADDVGKLMDGKKADMVFTDPPYGVNYQSNMRTKTKKFNVLKNDNNMLDISPIIQMFSEGWVFIWTSWKVQIDWIKKFESFNYPTNIVIWHKPGGGIGDLKHTFLSDYEVALVWHRGKELCGKRIGSVWTINKDSANKYVHPTQKPIALASEAIDKTTTKRNIVLDLFGGSGSTLIACEQTERICYMMELDEKYCDVIIKRWETLTGKKAEKVA